MKKVFFALGIGVLFLTMPAITAFPFEINQYTSKELLSEEKDLQTSENDWSGEFAGAFGDLKKVDGDWKFEKYGYVAGYYKGVKKGKLVGNFYNLDKEKIGSFAGVYAHRLFLGKIKISDKTAPAVGFLVMNETMFFGRIMSIVGPALHLVGKHWEI